ncbi:hypothetical protein PHMEG_00013684 [Phytophthora megakarya]|uniref:Uncharacterized protein n=1 Tax=Phytophthora megakarya TaxID=4795 RepID=A0A225W769_9STRA|nr:hypothetical protein PHMEG_00013684 [Phytophthora megakarya]
METAINSSKEVSTKWSAVQKDSNKRTSNDYNNWTVDQLKLVCTARKLSVTKNTNKTDRVVILRGYDEYKDAMDASAWTNEGGAQGKTPLNGGRGTVRFV